MVLSFLQRFLDGDDETSENSDNESPSRLEIQSLDTRRYLDHTVVPILLEALAEVARERLVLRLCNTL